MIDWLGDKWNVAGDKNTRDDVASISKSKNNKYVKIGEDGNVTLDFGRKSQKQIDKILKKDDGLNLINDLVNAKNKDGKELNFYYSSNWDKLGITEKNSGDTKVGYALVSEGTEAIINSANGDFKTIYPYFYNVSTTEYGSGKIQLLPKTGFDGQVSVAPGKAVKQINYQGANGEGKTMLTNARQELIKHELQENLLRTRYNMPYKEAHPETNKIFPDPFLWQFTFGK